MTTARRDPTATDPRRADRPVVRRPPAADFPARGGAFFAPEETDVRCPRCGHDNPDGSRFCAQCGAALSQERVGESTSVIPKVGGEESGEQVEVTADAADAHAGAVDSLPPGSALLVVKRGPNAGRRFLLDPDVTTAGRHPHRHI